MGVVRVFACVHRYPRYYHHQRCYLYLLQLSNHTLALDLDIDHVLALVVVLTMSLALALALVLENCQSLSPTVVVAGRH